MQQSSSWEKLPPLTTSSNSSSSHTLNFRGRNISIGNSAEDLTGQGSPVEARRAESAVQFDSRGDFERYDDLNVPPEYREALVRALKDDSNQSFSQSDFVTAEGYYLWTDTYNSSLQDVLCQLVRWRFATDYSARMRQERLNGSQSATVAKTEVQVYFKVVEAMGLISKENKPRHAYAVIEVGSEKWKTDVAQPSNNPTFNQHLNLTAKSMMDSVKLTIMDSRKEEFLGEVLVQFSQLITDCLKKGYVAQWYPLGPKQKDVERGRDPGKYVGGRVFIEANIKKEDQAPAKKPTTINDLQHHIVTCKMSTKRLYAILLGACLNLDLIVNGEQITDKTTELLGAESKLVLQIFARLWVLSDAFCVMSYLELLYEKFKKFSIPGNSLLAAYEVLYTRLKTGSQDWLNSFEIPQLVALLEKMYSYYETQVANYKDFYPKNSPRQALETTLLMLRMIHKNPLFKEAHPHIPESFREALRALITEAAVRRYQKLAEMSQPFDNTVAATIEASTRLAETILHEFELDVQYFRKPFRREMDIITITAETYLKYFVLELENITPELLRPEALDMADVVFDLYRKVRLLDKKYAPIVPGLKRLSMSAGFNVERWFAPFVHKWVASLAQKTNQWVSLAVKEDSFGSGDDDTTKSGMVLHSSSVTDLLSAINQNLETLASLKWSHPGQNAQFFLKFSKCINSGMEMYCDLLLEAEHRYSGESDSATLAQLKLDETFNSGLTGSHLASSVAAKLLNASFSPPSASTAPPVAITIRTATCVRVSNIEFALKKLDDIYREMDVKKVNEDLKNYLQSKKSLSRAGANLSNLMQSIQSSMNSGGLSSVADEEALAGGNNVGTFTFQVCRGERLKPSNKNGAANAYCILKTNTTETITRDMSLSRASSSPPLAKTRAINDTLQPEWDETFQALVPNGQSGRESEIDVIVYNKNVLFADEIMGRGRIKLAGRILDHQTHDVWVTLEPQGRVLIRVTMVGEEEDVLFWFRKTYAKLLRCRDDFRRMLVSTMCPFVRAHLQKALKVQEAVPESKGWLSFSSNAVTTSGPGNRMTAAQQSIDTEMQRCLVEDAVADLTDYLDSNFGVLCVHLATNNAQEVIKLLWQEILVIIEGILLPQLYGTMEKDRKRFNKRQLSFASQAMDVLCDFFHADGEGLGIPMSYLQGPRWKSLKVVLSLMAPPMNLLRIKRELDINKLSNKAGGVREQLLRLIRLVIEAPHATNLPSVDPDPLDQKQVADMKSYYELSLKL